MKDILKQMNEEYIIAEKQLDKISKVISSINSETDILEHEVMELGIHLENLGLYINELSLIWKKR